MAKTSDETVVTASLVENDASILLDAPLIMREVYRGHITAAQFLDLLRQGLARGLNPESWLQELVEMGQFAVARRLLLQSGGATAAELRRLSREWQDRCDETLNREQSRLEVQRTILDHSVLSDLEEMLVEARQLAAEWWFDLALEEFDEIGRLLDLQIAEAIKERRERFEVAQDSIMNVRREFLYCEPIVRQHGTTETVWELLGYADRLAASPDCDLRQIEKLCNAIKYLYQGASVDRVLLTEFRSLYGRPEAPIRAEPTVPIQEVPTTAPVPITRPAGLRLEWEPLSRGVRGLLNELVGERPSILQVDLSRAKMPPDVIWNEEAAKEAQSRARSLALGFVRDMDESSRVSELLQITRYLLHYWGEKRKNVPDRVRSELSDNLFHYANLRAGGLLKARRWDAACEYYRIAFSLRARRRYPSLVGANKSPVLNYFAAYATYRLAPEHYVHELRESKDLGPDQLLLTGLQMGLEWGDEDARPRVVQGLLKLAAENPWLLETSRAALRQIQDDTLRDLLTPGLELVGQLLHVEKQQVPLDEEFGVLVEAYGAFVQRLEDTLHQLLDATNSMRTLGTVPKVVEELQTLGHPWEPTDQELLSSLSLVADGISRYFITELPFQERDRLAETLLQRDIPSVIQLTLSSPTKLGVLHLNRVADNIQLLLEEDQASLLRVSLPTIEIRVEQSEWRSDGLYYCHLCVENNGDMRADDVRIQVEESSMGEYKVVDEGQKLGTIYPERPHSLHVRLRPTPFDETQDAFALFVRLRYKAPQRTGFEVRSLRLRVEDFAVQRPEFQPILNPYVVGGIVEDPDLFRGRQELIDVLLLEVANPSRTGSVVIFGQKRSGKSSLLYHSSLQAPDFVVPVFFDIPQILASLPRVDGTLPKSQREIIKEEMLGRFLLALIKRTVTQCQNRGLHILPMDWEELMEKPGPDFQFRQFLEQFRACEDGRRLLFLFDEFTALMEKVDEAVIDDTIMRLFKSLIEHGYFSCIICGLTEVYEAVKRYANQLAVSQPRMVDYLGYEAASGLIQDPIRMPDGRSRFYSQPVVDEIIDLTLRFPNAPERAGSQRTLFQPGLGRQA